MPSSLDCVLCLMRQSLEAARFASDDPAVHEKVLHGVFELVNERGFHVLPPLLGQEIHREIRRLADNPDPYAAQKKKFNSLMLERLDGLREIVRNSERPLETAVRIAIGGNTIDFALAGEIPVSMLDDAFRGCLERPIAGDFAAFEAMLKEAKHIFYLCDNSGEIVCDRLLIEEILHEFPGKRITAGVRGFPVLNDATPEDAAQVGLTKIVDVIGNGNDGLGTIIEQCGHEFMGFFRAADLIIAKGLANYETLIEDRTIAPQKNIAYLFKSKCNFIAEFSGTKKGDIVVQCCPGCPEKAE